MHAKAGQLRADKEVVRQLPPQAQPTPCLISTVGAQQLMQAEAYCNIALAHNMQLLSAFHVQAVHSLKDTSSMRGLRLSRQPSQGTQTADLGHAHQVAGWGENKHQPADQEVMSDTGHKLLSRERA